MYMNTDEINEELAVMQLSDSFFPTGLYATSNGLEFLFSNNEIKGLEDIKNMIKVKTFFIIILIIADLRRFYLIEQDFTSFCLGSVF